MKRVAINRAISSDGGRSSEAHEIQTDSLNGAPWINTIERVGPRVNRSRGSPERGLKNLARILAPGR
jgi:hypothetical protein